MERIKQSPSSLAAQKARDLKSSGRDILSLTQGEPDFDTPDHIIEAAYQAMRRGETRYTGVGGTAELKAAIIQKFRSENKLDYSSAEVMASTGGKQVIFNALMATLQAGDEVVIPTPCWVSYPEITQLTGATPIIVPCGPETGFKIAPDRLEAVITERTRWILLNSPCNPSGAVYSADELRALGDIVAKHPRMLVLSDDIYEHIIFDGAAFASFAQVRPDLRDRVLTVNGVSKAYAMTGWRLGYAGGPKWLIDTMTKLQSQSTTNPSAIAQAGSIAALTGPQDFLAERSASFQERRNLVVARLNAIDGLTCATPQGAFYAYPGCEALIGRRTPQGGRLGTDNDVVSYLLESVGVATVHGEAFGLSPYFRVSSATSHAMLEDACERIATAVRALD
jgi:aspartate aminotransferase